MAKNFAANLKIGATMSSSVGRVFGAMKARIKEQENALKGLRAEYKLAAKGSGEWAGKLDQLKAKIKDTEDGLKKLRKAAEFDVGKAFRGIGTTMVGDLKRLGVVAGVAAGAITAVGASVFAVTKGFVDWADDIGDTAEALGISTKALQTWQFAASTVGVGGSKMTASIAKFQKTVADGGDQTVETFRTLGINMARLQKLDLDAQLSVVAEAFKDYKGDVPKAALAMKIFGRSGYQLAGILSQGEEGLRRFREEGEKMGAVLDDEAAKKAGEAASALDSFGMTMIGLRNIIAIEFVPTLQRLAVRFTKFVRDNAPKLRAWAVEFGKTLETKVVPAMERLFDKLPGIIDRIGEFAGGFWRGLNAVKDFVGGWDNLGIALVALNFAPTLLAIGSMTKGLYALAPAVWAAVGPWAALAAAIGAIPFLVGDGDAGKGLQIIKDAIVGDITAIGEILKEKWTAFAQWFGRNWEALTQVIEDTASKIRGIFNNLVADIKDAFEKVVGWIGTKFDELLAKAAALGAKIKGFFSFGFGGGGGETSMRVPTVAPAESMPGQQRGTAQNTINIKVDAPGQDGTGIARQLRQELSRKPLFDYDGALVPS
jgi:hypothetical protein